MLQWIWVCRCFFEILISITLETDPGTGLRDHAVVQLLVFCGTAVLFSIMVAPISIPPTAHKGSFYPTTWPTFIIFLIWVILTGVRISHCGFDLCFPDDLCCWKPSYTCWPCICPWEKNVPSCHLLEWWLCLPSFFMLSVRKTRIHDCRMLCSHSALMQTQPHWTIGRHLPSPDWTDLVGEMNHPHFNSSTAGGLSLEELTQGQKPGLGCLRGICMPLTWDAITSWETDGETVETVADFIFLGSKITADGDCSLEIKRHLLFGRKVMTNLDSILKSRDITVWSRLWFFQWSCMDVKAGL